jgi:AcrR family transcriptional regulator
MPEPESDRSYPSVWLRPRREPRSTLTRDRIVAEALRLLDTEGAEALSMRKLAAALGVGATSLYWHVANRDELIELVVNEVNGELEVPDADEVDDWREATRRFAHSMRSAIVRHRWVVSELDHVVAAVPGPNLSLATERMLAVFETAGFPLPEAERVLNTVASYVSGIALSEAALRGLLARHGQSPQDWLDDMLSDAEQIAEGHDRLRTTMSTYADKNPEHEMEEDFEYGLERVLDGLQARLDASS